MTGAASGSPPHPDPLLRGRRGSLAALLLFAACTPGNAANFSVLGDLDGRPIDMGFTLNAKGKAVELDEGARPLMRVGGTRAFSILRKSACPTEPCPDVAALTLQAPRTLLGGGTWTVPEGSTLELLRDGEVIETIPLGNVVGLAFDEPDFSTSGPLVLRQKAHFAPGPAATRALSFEGFVELEYQCTAESPEPFCGGPVIEDGATSPLQSAYTVDECPRELVAPYEAQRQWRDDTLLLGNLEIPCRHTEGKSALCHVRREEVEAQGCTWRVHFLTDGSGGHFSVAGWADPHCAVQRCVTYRAWSP